ncbi:hypothetical protein ACJX0J_029869 [Zea mays]
MGVLTDMKASFQEAMQHATILWYAAKPMWRQHSLLLLQDKDFAFATIYRHVYLFYSGAGIEMRPIPILVWVTKMIVHDIWGLLRNTLLVALGGIGRTIDFLWTVCRTGDAIMGVLTDMKASFQEAMQHATILWYAAKPMWRQHSLLLLQDKDFAFATIYRHVVFDLNNIVVGKNYFKNISCCCHGNSQITCHHKNTNKVSPELLMALTADSINLALFNAVTSKPFILVVNLEIYFTERAASSVSSPVHFGAV